MTDLHVVVDRRFFERDPEDDLRAARGIINGIALSLTCFWLPLWGACTWLMQ